ncbi:MAG: thiamine pyrophosphate-dependent enzyme [Halofilum sp. (in: g-proteobacteria)]|nr:thiamine pyrophosphate-dependent enzyme [Halofilum sp. (in: g-proteobacteria)]
MNRNRSTKPSGSARPIDRVEIVDANFRTFVDGRGGSGRPDSPNAVLPDSGGLDTTGFLELFESQMLSRHLDFEARAMRGRDEGFYTIGSAGHEGNAAVARATRHTDPAFLHYRSGAFMIERARAVSDVDPVHDTALSLAASAEDPISGGRHKVWGSVALNVPPQTSTIASHLPKAVGTAIAHGIAGRCGTRRPVPDDALVVCSFGDAAVNHATALAGFNAAAWTAYQNLPCPVLFVCEDNGIGVSVQTPKGWVAASFRERPGIAYFHADGCDLVAAHAATRAAAEYVRRHRRPAFLHLALVRLLGHAGSDVESRYRPTVEIERDEAADPLLRSAAIALDHGLLTPQALLERYEAARLRVQEAAARAARRPRLESRAEAMRPLAPYSPDAVRAEAERADYHAARERIFGGAERLPERQPPRHLAIQIGRALHDLLAKYEGAIAFGEDIAAKGGVYTVTSGLAESFPPHRVFNTLLDETTILGLAQGAGMMGLLPIPEIQYLAYVHNAADQIRGEACSQQFFSNGQYANPMLVRIAGLAYQKGFGGHFHNDNSFAALRDIPGLVIACPARGDDAVAMLRTCAALCQLNGRVVTFIEPIALYMTKDLHERGDGQWLFPYPGPGEAIAPGEPRIYAEDANDLLIVTYANGVPMSLRVTRQLEAETGRRVRILDLRWLKPLNREAIASHARACGRVLVVDEGRETGGIAEQIVTGLVEDCGDAIRMARVAGADSYIPLGAAANTVLVSEDEILQAARGLLG